MSFWAYNFITKRITISENIVRNKNTNRCKTCKTDISSLLSKCDLESKDEISVLPILDLLLFLFHTMISLQVIIFVIMMLI